MATLAYLYALTAIGLWATLAFLSQKLSSVPPFLLVGVTLSLGSLCGVPWIRQWRVPLPTLALGIFGLFGYHFALFWAFRTAPAVEANLINYLWPLLIVLLSPLILPHYRLGARHILSGFMGFSGAALIVAGGSLSLIDGWHSGYLFALIAAVIWAIYSLLTKRVALFPTGAVGLFLLVSGMASLFCHFLFEARYSLSSSELPYVFIIAIGPLGIAFFLWDAAIKAGDPRIIGSLSFFTPLLSTGLLVLSGVGQFSWVSFLALILIVAGAWIGAQPEKY